MKATRHEKLYTAESILFGGMLLLMGFFGFVERFISIAGNLVDLAMMGFGLIAVLTLIQHQYQLKEEQKLPLAIVGAFTLSLIISLAVKHRLNGIAQYALYIGYIAPLLLWHRITPRMAYAFLMPLLVLIGFLQYPFDLIFPRLNEDILDAYSGTFAIANNKSRFLFLVILATAICYRRSSVFNKIALPPLLILMMLSFLLGDSVFVYAFGIVAIFLGFLHRKKWLALLIAGLAVGGVVQYFQSQSDNFFVEATYNRFFDPEHGTLAVILAAAKIVYETYGLGGGLGEFISRTAQTMGGEYVSIVPRTMAVFGVIYEDVVAPYGVPAYVSVIAETGLVGIIIAVLLVTYLYRNSHDSFLGFATFIYVLTLTLYMPMFFETPDGMIFLYAYLIINKALLHRDMQLVNGDDTSQIGLLRGEVVPKRFALVKPI